MDLDGVSNEKLFVNNGIEFQELALKMNSSRGDAYMECFTSVIAFLTILILYQIWLGWNRPPGPWNLPFLGYLPWIDHKAPYKTLSKLAKTYGSIYGLWMGSVYTVVLTDVALIKMLFSLDSTTGRAPLYLTHGIMGGYGLISAEGELWKEHRKFARRTLKQMSTRTITEGGTNKIENLLTEQVNELISLLRDCVNVGFDPQHLIRHTVGSIMNTIVFGKAWDKNDKEWVWLQKSQEEGCKKIGIAGALNFLPFLRHLPKYQKVMEYILKGKLETHKVYQQVIEEKEEEFRLNYNEEVDSILQAFILEKDKLDNKETSWLYSNDQLKHLLADLFGAGLDTTVSTLRWYFLYMAKNPNIQRTIRTDIDDVTEGRAPGLGDMGRIPLYEASMQETQRIRSVVPVGIPHGAVEDLEVYGYKIPKGAMLVPLQWAIHMDEKSWRDPEVFNPWRFIDDDGKFVKSDKVLPFQFGKRMCIGDDLAKKMLFLIATNVLQNFTLSLASEDAADLEGICGITLCPKSYDIILTPINPCGG